MKHQTQKITEHVMRLWSDAQQNGYLITGKSRAALITKDGSEADKQLKSVWELTDKPVTVLLSDGRLGSSGAGADAELCGGMVFDLGGVHVRTLATSSHEMGAIAFLAEEECVLIAKDPDTGMTSSIIPEAAAAAEYLAAKHTDSCVQQPFARKYPNLCKPITIAGVTFRNRMFSAPMGGTDITNDGCIGPKSTAFYELRAKGGAGAVTVSECMVHPETDGSHAYHLDTAILNSLASAAYTADAIRRHGAMPSLELSHSGIGEMVGYSDTAHFARTFKKLEGMSANEYRNTL